jgi:hypothetical protein
MGAQPNILRASNGETRPNALHDVYGLSREVIEAHGCGRAHHLLQRGRCCAVGLPPVGDSKFSGSYKLFARRSARNSNAARPFIPYPTLLFDGTGRLTGAINMLVEK